MKRRTIDLVLSAGGLVVAIILLVGGLVLTSNANFAKNYVHDQMIEQEITFPTVDAINANPATAGVQCLLDNAEQVMTTGKQAECYANNFIGAHLKSMGAGTPYQGWSYSKLGDAQTEVKAQVSALDANADGVADDVTKQADLDAANALLAKVNAQRETVFKGEMLRGILLTSYGFSELGAKAALGATVAYIGAGVMFVLALLGFFHGLTTPTTEAFAPPAARREKSGAAA